MMLEHGFEVDHTTLYRWVQHDAPEIERRLRWHYKAGIARSWRVDVTYVKVKGKWAYLYRAVDKRGKTIDFYLSSTRSAKVAKRFLSKALKSIKPWAHPKTINTDKAPAFGSAIEELKIEEKCPKYTLHRQVKYLNNIVDIEPLYELKESRNPQGNKTVLSEERHGIFRSIFKECLADKLDFYVLTEPSFSFNTQSCRSIYNISYKASENG